MKPSAANPDQSTFGAIFDWDGVVIDSSSQHEESWEKLALEQGLPLPAGHFKRGFGMKNEAIIPHLLKWTSDPAEITRLSLRKEEWYRSIILEKGIQALPGVKELLELLHRENIPAVIGSSTHRLNIEVTLKVLGLAHLFAGIRSAEDVTAGKPDPQVFLLAAQTMHRNPAHCIVFEDAQVGIDAGLAGGMKVIGVATTHAAEHLHGAHWTVNRLTEVDWAGLQTIWSL
jgi:HAD superfamily hydrolase (TIGR01509 family)